MYNSPSARPGPRSSGPCVRPKLNPEEAFPYTQTDEASEEISGQMKIFLKMLKGQHEESLAQISGMLRIMEGGLDKDFQQDVAEGSKEKPSQEQGQTENGGWQGNSDDVAEEVASETNDAVAMRSMKSEVTTIVDQLPSRFASLLKRESINFNRAADVTGTYARIKRYSVRMFRGQRFDYVMGFIILLNSICVGIDTQLSIEAERDTLPLWLDYVFILIYVVEIVVRLIAFGKSNFSDHWFQFDFALVTLGVVANVMIPLVSFAFAVDGDAGALSSTLVIRSTRLLRLIRALRLLKQFRSIWRLVNGLLTSGNAMMSTFFLLLLVLYIAACIGIELITKDKLLQTHETTEWIVAYHFGSLQRTLLTLMAFMSADSVAGVYAPLIILKPELSIYFTILLLLVSVALMNLVTAVLVEGALEAGAADKEVQKFDTRNNLKAAVPKLLDLFKENDVNCDGMLTLEEVENVPMDMLPDGLFDDSIQSLADIYDLLDVSGDGSLSQVEFVEGLLNLFLQDVPIQTIQTLKLLRSNDEKIGNLAAKVGNLEARLGALQR